jgi:hypothetical protein
LRQIWAYWAAISSPVDDSSCSILDLSQLLFETHLLEDFHFNLVFAKHMRKF